MANRQYSPKARRKTDDRGESLSMGLHDTRNDCELDLARPHLLNEVLYHLVEDLFESFIIVALVSTLLAECRCEHASCCLAVFSVLCRPMCDTFRRYCSAGEILTSKRFTDVGDCLHMLLCPPLRVLGRLGAILGGLGTIVRRSWSDLGRTWAVLDWCWVATSSVTSVEPAPGAT